MKLKEIFSKPLVTDTMRADVVLGDTFLDEESEEQVKDNPIKEEVEMPLQKVGQ